MTIYVVRHGETVANREGRWLGRSDSPLTPRGVEQSGAYSAVLARLIADYRAVELHSSPLHRARHTARVIATRLELEPEKRHISPLLAEHAFGHWEGFTEEEIEVRFPGSLEARHRAHWTYVVPGGESYEQVYRRAYQWLESLGDTPVTIAVTHAKTSRTLRGAYLGLEPSGILTLKHPQDRIYVMEGGQVSAISCAPK